MKITEQPRSLHLGAAFTLVELLISMVTVIAVMGGALGAYIYGLRMVQVTQPKLTASDDARRLVTLFTEDVRRGFSVKVGTRDGGTFTRITAPSYQAGDALRISLSATNTNSFVLYFFDSNDKTLKRTTNNSNFATLATSVTNRVIFSGEDFTGQISTNEDNNMVIGMTLQFYQLQGASGTPFDWYQLRAKSTKRTLF